GLVALIVNRVASDGDIPGRNVGGGECSVRAIGSDLAGAGAERIGERAILRAAAFGADGGVAAWGDAGRICRAGDCGRLVRHDAETGGAGGVAVGRGAFADDAAYRVVARREAGGGDGVVGRVGLRTYFAAGRGPRVDGQQMLVLFEVQGFASDGDRIAGIDGDGRDFAGVGRWHGRRGLAEPNDESGAEAQGVYLAFAAREAVGTDLLAEVGASVLEVHFGNAQGEVVVECGKNVVDAAAAIGSKAPYALVGAAAVLVRRPDLRTTAERLQEGNDAAHLAAVFEAALQGGETVVGIVELLVVFGVDAPVGPEVSCHTADEAAWQSFIGLVIKIAVECLEIGVAAENVDAGGRGRCGACRRRLGDAKRRYRHESCNEQKRAQRAHEMQFH